MTEATAEDLRTRETSATMARRVGTFRTCVGCGEVVLRSRAGDTGALVRLIVGADGAIAVDGRGGGFGRGAHVHAQPSCVARAARSGLLKATKGRGFIANEGDEPRSHEAAKRSPLTPLTLAGAISRVLDHRVERLIATAVRSKQVASGADSVTEACHRERAELVLVACDAAHASGSAEVRRAISEGRAVAWGNQQDLDALARPRTARDVLDDSSASDGVIAILSAAIAHAVKSAVQTMNGLTAASVTLAATSTRSARAPRSAGPVKSPRSPVDPVIRSNIQASTGGVRGEDVGKGVAHASFTSLPASVAPPAVAGSENARATTKRSAPARRAGSREHEDQVGSGASLEAPAVPKAPCMDHVSFGATKRRSTD